jgi:hypothetical protein
MIPGIVSSAGSKRAQKSKIAEIKQLRDTAADLRSRVSKGSYDDEDLRQFWRLTEAAGTILRISNPDLGKIVGLGDGYFSSVSKDRRRPKFAHLLRALTAIVEVADERLLRSDTPAKESSHATADARLKQDHDELLRLAVSLERMARDEIDRLCSERPNDPAAIRKNEMQRELLLVLAEGFNQIASALSALHEQPNQSILLRRAREVIATVGIDVTRWWERNGAEAVDWGMRLPVFVAGVAGLGWAGANMSVGTAAVAAIVGGSKVASVIKNLGKGE